MRFLIVLGTIATLAGCSYPNSSAQQGADKGQLYFPAPPPGAHIILDGQDVGLAESYTGKQVLAVTPGTHRIVLNAGSTVILDKKYYVGSGSSIAVTND